MGMAAMRFSRFVSGELGEAFDRALQTAEFVKGRRELYRDKKPADVRLAVRPFGAARSHRANCRHPRIGNSAVAWKRRRIARRPVINRSRQGSESRVEAWQRAVMVCGEKSIAGR